MSTITEIIDIKKLEHEIELLRQEMIVVGMRDGFTNDQTIQISQRLDEYIVKYISTKNAQ